MDLSKAIEKLSGYQKEHAEMEDDAMLLIQTQQSAVESEAVQGEQLQALEKSHISLQKNIKAMRENEIKLEEEYVKAEGSLKFNSAHAVSWRQQLLEVREKNSEEQREHNADVREVLLNLKRSHSDPSQSNELENGVVEEEEEVIELLPDMTPEMLESGQQDIEHIQEEIDQYERARSKQGHVDRTALMDWIKKNGLYRIKLAELEAVTIQRNAARKEYETLRGQRLDMFMGGFGVITLKLKEMYQMITLGGDAELELLDSLDPFSEGIVFSVRPPKKSWKNISNLSGGEKTLSSLALVFALHHYKPTPLYVMDEIDAALVRTYVTPI